MTLTMAKKVETRENFLSHEECVSLIALARPNMTKSFVWDVAKGTTVQSDYRRSDQLFLAPGQTELVKTIENRISETTNTPLVNGEGLQVVHYEVGGYYKQHFDYFDPAFPGNLAALQRGGQRVLTCMIYLNNVQEGGETTFPSLELSFAPKEGMALIWRNVLSDGKPDPDTMHSAEPVKKGEKWIVTRWVRERRFL